MMSNDARDILPLTVVIPTYNRADLVGRCLSSLADQTAAPQAILVVDDGSTDGTAAYLQSHWPAVRVVSQPRNQGFACAVNAGLRNVHTPWALLLNNDMTLDPGFLRAIWEGAQASGADMIAPLVLWQDDPRRIYSAGDRIRKNGRPEAIGFREDRETFVLPDEIFSVSAGAGLYRTAVFEAAGFFDERFIAYFEDSDLGFRARLLGFDAALTPEAIAYHEGSASIAGRTWWRACQCHRNHVLLVVKNFPLLLIVIHGPFILWEILHQTRMAFSACRCEFGAIRALIMVLKIRIGVIRLLPRMVATRWRIQRRRTLPVWALNQLLDPGDEP